MKAIAHAITYRKTCKSAKGRVNRRSGDREVGTATAMGESRNADVYGTVRRIAGYLRVLSTEMVSLVRWWYSC